MRHISPAVLGLALSVPAALLSVAHAQPISGLYVGGAGGVGFLQSEQSLGITSGSVLTRARPATTESFKSGYAGVASLGYALGNGVRLELEGSLRGNDINKDNTAGLATSKGSERKTGVMGNVLFDMDIGSPYIYPYFGAGAGFQSVRHSESRTPLAGGVGSHISGTTGAFAYQAMLGAAFPVAPVVGLSATLEYRYLGMSGARKDNVTQGGALVGTRRSTNDDTHSILVGLRYAFNVTPPASPIVAAPAPVPAPAPAPAPSRSYLVFFDWDRADLTDRARQIIAEAAAASTRVAATRIEVAGHADKSGTPAYNQGLSRRRAAMVAAELVRLGVPAAAISVSSFGDTRPLVPTAAGVREPQNRRVEIVLK